MDLIVPARTRVLRREVEILLPGYEVLNRIQNCICLVTAYEPSGSTDLEVRESYLGGPELGTRLTLGLDLHFLLLGLMSVSLKYHTGS